MWFPVDQPGYRERHPEDVAAIRAVLESAAWKDDDALPVFTDPYPEVVDQLPANFDDDLHTKPEAHRQWRWDQQHGLWGYIDPSDKKAWLRHLDYYVHLHRMADRNLGTVLSALEASGAWDDTIIIFTSDHGDMCGSHGLRSKGPFVYDEIMRVPLYVKVPGMTTPGSVTSSLGSHVDLAATICSLAGVEPATAAATVQGTDLSPILADPTTTVRDHILFAQDSAQTAALNNVRYALRGFYDGHTKYARYYGVGGGQAVDRPVGEGTRPQAVRRRLQLRRQRPRVVRPRLRPPRAGQPGQRPLPTVRVAGHLRADAHLRTGVVPHVRLRFAVSGSASSGHVVRN